MKSEDDAISWNGQNNIDLKAPLVDREGFPRADIDVAGVRTARVQIIRLNNDLKSVVNDMARLLERGLPREEREDEFKEEEEMDVEESVENKPWAKVDGVFPGSPAASAVRLVLLRLLCLFSSLRSQGLQRGDLIIFLGSVNSKNHDSLKALPPLLSSHQNVR